MIGTVYVYEFWIAEGLSKEDWFPLGPFTKHLFEVVENSLVSSLCTT
jgi:hypothetical protein